MTTNFHLLLTALLALIAPLGLLVTRRELRRVRTVVVEELISTAFKDQINLPQVALILSRYKSRSGSSGAGLSRQEAVSPYLGAIFFWLICFIGFLILFTPADLLITSGGALRPNLAVASFWTFPAGGNAGAHRLDALRVVSVAGFGFLGGYIFQLGYLTRAALNQELSALSFVRASFRVLMGIIVAVIVYRAFGGVTEYFSDMNCAVNMRCDPPSAKAPGQVAVGFGAALGVAFVTGMWPDGAVSSLSKRLRMRLKLVSQTALDQSEVIPVEVVDGIDSEASFRLQESNIYDVQNLAVANPIELYAETPYGIFECFDWILQAQLCLVVGPEAFRALKNHNVRTIFDLERAVLADGAPDDYVCAIGAIILSKADSQFQAGIGLSSGGDPSKAKPDVIRHVVAIMGDDLHVHRLRALWKALAESTAASSSPWLFETGWLPGEQDRFLAPLATQAEADLAKAAAAGEQYKAAVSSGADAASLAGLAADCLAAVTRAATHGADAKNRLRRLWDPKKPRKRANDHSLEPFIDDPAFVQLLA